MPNQESKQPINQAKLVARFKERLDLETLLDGVETDAERCLELDGPGAKYAEDALEFAAAARHHVAAGDTRQAAMWSLKAGAAAERRLLESLVARDWWRQKELVDRLGLPRHKVSRAVSTGKLRTNGRKGQACRINPFSVVEWCYANGFVLDDLIDGKTDSFVAPSEEI